MYITDSNITVEELENLLVTKKKPLALKFDDFRVIIYEKLLLPKSKISVDYTIDLMKYNNSVLSPYNITGSELVLIKGNIIEDGILAYTLYEGSKINMSSLYISKLIKVGLTIDDDGVAIPSCKSLIIS
jgi:hypothetical protein